MGDVADDINNGLMCNICGVWMEDVLDQVFDDTDESAPILDNPPGYLRTREDCRKEQLTI